MRTRGFLLMGPTLLLVLASSLYFGLPARRSLVSASTERAIDAHGAPEAKIDLATAEGAKLVSGEWRYSDTKIVEVDFRGPGPDLKPSGKIGRASCRERVCQYV